MDDQALNEQSLEDRLVGILEAEEGQPEEEEPQEQEEVETEAEAESEEEQPEEPQKITLKRGEEEVEVDLEEAKNLAQMGYDYTKKTQEVAEQRKQVEMYAQAVKAQEQAIRQQAELQQVLIKEIAKVESINDQIAAYERVDWNTLSDTDPVQAQKAYFAYTQLMNQRTQAQQDIQNKYQQLTQQRTEQDQMRLAQAQQELVKMIPDWNADKAREIREAGKSYGFDDNELSSITDPRMVKVLAEAAAYRKLQAEKATVTKKVSDKPAVVKPGAKDTKRAAQADYAKDRAALKKTGDQHLAAKLIERML